MAWIQVHTSHGREVEKEYRLWGNAQPRQPGQIGGTMWSHVTGSPNPVDDTIDMQFPDAFIDEIEGSAISFKRL